MLLLKISIFHFPNHILPSLEAVYSILYSCITSLPSISIIISLSSSLTKHYFMANLICFSFYINLYHKYSNMLIKYNVFLQFSHFMNIIRLYYSFFWIFCYSNNFLSIFVNIFTTLFSLFFLKYYTISKKCYPFYFFNYIYTTIFQHKSEYRNYFLFIFYFIIIYIIIKNCSFYIREFLIKTLLKSIKNSIMIFYFL